MQLQLELLESLAASAAQYDEVGKFQSLLQQVRQDVEDLDVQISMGSIDDQSLRPTLLLEGPDAGVARNCLVELYGSHIAFSDVTTGTQRIGVLRDPNKVGFGLFVDVGITNPAKDVLIPVRVLREQLAGGKKLPLRAMVYALGWVEGFPLVVEITAANVKVGKVEARLAPSEIETFQSSLRERYERVLVVGATRQHVKQAIKQTRHLRDILAVERHGLLAGQVVLKPGTQAPGIIHAIGAQLPEARLGAFRPTRWKALFTAEVQE